MTPVDAQVDVKKLPNWRAVWRPGFVPKRAADDQISGDSNAREDSPWLPTQSHLEHVPYRLWLLWAGVLCSLKP